MAMDQTPRRVALASLPALVIAERWADNDHELTCMRTGIFTALMVMVVAIGCGGRDDMLRDVDGNTYVLRDMPDGRIWMTDNMSLAHRDSYCYGDSALECRRYGRLYTWPAAAEACRLLGTGWRLPTDDEWRQLAKGYGGVRGDSEDGGQSAYTALLREGVSGFNAVLGGGRERGGSYSRIEEHGFYWSATQSDTDHAWFYNFGRGGGLLNRHSGGDKAMALAVRCIKTF
jgi:uncharacterized protein (TIGR02145 family)